MIFSTGRNQITCDPESAERLLIKGWNVSDRESLIRYYDLPEEYAQAILDEMQKVIDNADII